MFVLNIHAPDCLIIFFFPAATVMANNFHNWKKPLALVFVVQICQISLVTLSALSNYLFLCLCVEYPMPLCQNIRRRGESDDQFPMEIFFSFFFFVFFSCTKDKHTGQVWLWGGQAQMDFTVVCAKALVPQTFVLPDVNASGLAELRGSFPACRVEVCSFGVPRSRTGRSSPHFRRLPGISVDLPVERGSPDAPLPLRPLCSLTPPPTRQRNRRLRSRGIGTPRSADAGAI